MPEDEAALLDDDRMRLEDNAVARSTRTLIESGQEVGDHGG